MKTKAIKKLSLRVGGPSKYCINGVPDPFIGEMFRYDSETFPQIAKEAEDNRKLAELRYGKMVIDIPKDADRAGWPYVLVSRSVKQGKNSLVIFLHNLHLDLRCPGRYTPSEIRRAVCLVRDTRDILIEAWEELYGKEYLKAVKTRRRR